MFFVDPSYLLEHDLFVPWFGDFCEDVPQVEIFDVPDFPLVLDFEVECVHKGDLVLES
mgnify:CR=1 FL=1